MATTSIEDLQNKIERLVREHLAEQRRVATAAVERAFACAVAPKVQVARSKTGRRRARSEMAELADKLFAAIRANPGETIAVIAAEVGETAKSLNRPMTHLKQAGRVRSAGQRHLTRYFPMTNSHKGA